MPVPDPDSFYYAIILTAIMADPRYQRGRAYGKPRRGHQEGTVQAHIEDLEDNLSKLRMDYPELITEERWWKLKILIHVHDTFKVDAQRDSPILDPDNHASLARKFLSEFCNDNDLLNIVQYHDLGYAVYLKLKKAGSLSSVESAIKRVEEGLNHIQDLDLYLLFAVIDSGTASKGREMITWYVHLVNMLRPEVNVHSEHILPGPMLVGDTW